VGSRFIAPLVPKPCIRQRTVKSFTLWPLCPRERIFVVYSIRGFLNPEDGVDLENKRKSLTSAEN
jgi:hypothetical protein